MDNKPVFEVDYGLYAKSQSYRKAVNNRLIQEIMDRTQAILMPSGQAYNVPEEVAQEIRKLREQVAFLESQLGIAEHEIAQSLGRERDTTI